MSNARTLIGEHKPDGLIYDSEYPILTKSVQLRAGQGELKRGTVLCVSTGAIGDGKYVKIGTQAQSDEALTPDCILTDDTDATSTIVMQAYRTGHFARNNLVGTITQQDESTLRTAGIMLSDTI